MKYKPSFRVALKHWDECIPVGFYKRGCQAKTLFLFREEGMFFRHPAPSAAARILAGVRLAEPISPVVCGVMS
jgi:hypothetical protein